MTACMAKHFISVLQLKARGPPFKSGKKSHTFYPKHEWFAVNKVKNKK